MATFTVIVIISILVAWSLGRQVGKSLRQQNHVCLTIRYVDHIIKAIDEGDAEDLMEIRDTLLMSKP